MEQRFVTDFLELPREQLRDFRRDVRGRWRYLGAIERRRHEAIDGLRRVAPSHVDEGDFYFGTAASYLEGRGVLSLGWERHGALLTDLVEMAGGGWDVIEPRPGLASELDPALLDGPELRRHFEELDQRPAPEAPEHMLAAIAALRDALRNLDASALLLIRSR